MLWFGEPWPADWETNGRAPVCADEAGHVPTPIGLPCLYCAVMIDAGDSGVSIPGPRGLEPAHLGCLLRAIGVVDAEGWPR